MVLVLPMLIACSGNDAVVELPERTELFPLEEENRAPAVPPTDEEDTPETFTLDSGFSVTGFHHWTHMRGWVHADIADVWDALQQPDVMVDRRVIDSYATTDRDFRPDVDHSYLFTSQMRQVGREFEFDITWLQGVQQGEVDAPQLVIATWELTDGPPFLEKIEGSIELEAVEPGLTEIRGIFHMRAFPLGAKQQRQYFTDLHADLRATLDGEPVETYD